VKFTTSFKHDFDTVLKLATGLGLTIKSKLNSSPVPQSSIVGLITLTLKG
jgi:hypothetical protein